MMLFRREGFLPEARTKLLLREESRSSSSPSAPTWKAIVQMTADIVSTASHAARRSDRRSCSTPTRSRVEFGGLIAVNDVDFTIPEESIVGLIGPNGAGKTTFFNVLTGLYKPTTGTRRRSTGSDVTGRPPHKIASLGMARTFQNIRLFGLMTAEENVMVAMHPHLKRGVVSHHPSAAEAAPRGARGPRRRPRSCSTSSASAALRDEFASNLSYGDQRRLEVARALALQARSCCCSTSRRPA